MLALGLNIKWSHGGLDSFEKNEKAKMYVSRKNTFIVDKKENNKFRKA
jgi:hypothetical protein